MFDHIDSLAARADEGSTRALIGQLAVRGAAHTERVLEALRERGAAIVPLLSDTLDQLNSSYPKPNVRRHRKAVCRLLGELGSGELVDQLLDTPSDAEDVAAQRALVELGDAAVEGLVEALDGPFTHRTERAIDALTRIGALDREDVAEALVHHFDTLEPDWDRDRLLIAALTPSAHRPRVHDALLARGTQGNPWIEVEALRAAAPHAPERVVDHLARIAPQAGNPDIITRFGRVLATLHSAPDAVRERARELLRQWLCDQITPDLIEALATLGSVRDAELIREVGTTGRAWPATLAALRAVVAPDLSHTVRDLVPRCSAFEAQRLVEALRGAPELETAALDRATSAGLTELAARLALGFDRPDAAIDAVGRTLADRLARANPDRQPSVWREISRLTPQTTSPALLEAVREGWRAIRPRRTTRSKRRRGSGHRRLAEAAIARLAVDPIPDEAAFDALGDALTLHRDVLYSQLGQNVHAGILDPHPALLRTLDQLDHIASALAHHTAAVPSTLRAELGEAVLEVLGLMERLARLWPSQHPDAELARCRESMADACLALADVQLQQLLPRRLRETLRHGDPHDERDSSLDLARRTLERRNAPGWLLDALRVGS